MQRAGGDHDLVGPGKATRAVPFGDRGAQGSEPGEIVTSFVQIRRHLTRKLTESLQGGCSRWGNAAMARLTEADAGAASAVLRVATAVVLRAPRRAFR